MICNHDNSVKANGIRGNTKGRLIKSPAFRQKLETLPIFLSCSRVSHGNEENEEINLAYKIVYFGDQNIDNGTANISTAKGTTSRPAYNTIPRWNDCGSVSFR